MLYRPQPGSGAIDDLLRWNSGPRRAGDVCRYADQCRGRQHLDLPQAPCFQGPEKARHGDRFGGQSFHQPVGGSTLTEGYDNPETGERETLMNAPTLFQAARRVGHVVRTIHQTEASALESSDVSFDVSFLF